MLEWLAVSTSVELGKLVLEKVLDIGKPVLEEYVQDFFKHCLKNGVAQLRVEALKEPMAEAIGIFIRRFVKELQISGVPESSIRHYYRDAIKQFVKNRSVLSVLGQAFDTGCKQIDYAQLETIWMQKPGIASWQFPSDEFDWRGISKEYVHEVKGIVKAYSELREILEAELLETVARNTTQLSPGFDVEAYRRSLQCSYGYLKLYTIDSTDRVDAIKLWNMFIEQTVREALPPTRYELPLDLKCQLQEQGQLEGDLSSDALEHYKKDYFQQPARKVLEIVRKSNKSVILGDPGSGKSTLLQYIALDWMEGKSERLPLLIELRDYATSKTCNFLDFLHRGRGADWQFDQLQLSQHLKEYPTLVMFDGLDEVFDRATQATVIDDIIRFAQQYSNAQVLVTSRIVGYNPDRLKQASFRHFTIQPLSKDEIDKFIDRWYDLALINDPEQLRLRQRLKDAIAKSQAIRSLADNPLLLTMMAILNRRQELPRDRVDLYDQASRTLLYHWDVDHKRLQLPIDTIGRREKQEMLRAVAYEMQNSAAGLKGNIIHANQLTHVLTKYLRDQGFAEPREKANKLIEQLRHRNWILCDRGADTYGFVHRTFLEYFCALEVVHRFEKQRTLTFEQLKDEIFLHHCQDETWHEVLKLISGLVEEKVAEAIIEALMGKDAEPTQFSKLELSVRCLLEVKNRYRIKETDQKLLEQLKSLVEEWRYPEDKYSETFQEPCDTACKLIGEGWDYSPSLFSWFQSVVRQGDDDTSSFIAIREIGQSWKDKPEVSKWLKDLAINGPFNKGAILALTMDGKGKEDIELLKILKHLYSQGAPGYIVQAAIFGIFEIWNDEPDTMSIIKECLSSEDPYIRWPAVEALGRDWEKILIHSLFCINI